MLVIGIILGSFGIGLLCWLVINLAVYALPVYAGMTVGLVAHHCGAGALGVLIVGVAGGAVTLVVGQAVFRAVASPLVCGTHRSRFRSARVCRRLPRRARTCPHRRACRRLERGVCRRRLDRCRRNRCPPHDDAGIPVRRATRVRFGVGSTRGKFS